ncbi:transcriptional adapter 2-alpha-like [Mytilus galloprovincialis]|uniref:transcriptional adapter 2-alpha-like n=1 Tax=Mytilus galloprovincialis TaxID=29158 RepID=UPI003F7CBA2D
MEEEHYCMNCKCELRKPYIVCKAEVCHSMTICVHCFSKGVIFGVHQNDHPYTVCRTDFPLFEQTWTAEEETTLLDIMSDCGYGNWSDVAHRLRTKSQSECQNHYNKYFIDKPHEDLPHFKEAERTVYPQPIVYKLCDDPPRYPENNDLSGYMAGRGDFTIEYDNFMELEIKHLDFDEEDEDSKMQLGVLDVYYDCMKERWKRKKIVRDYGLINIPKVQVASRRYNYTIKDLIDKLRVFITLVSPDEYCKYIEAIHYERELKHDIKKLQSRRENGMTSMQQSKMYHILNSRRNVVKSKRHLMVDLLSHLKDETSCQTWLQRQAVLDNMSKGGLVVLPNAPRKTAPPLDISSLPGYEKLGETEQEICANIRLVPEAYIEFRDSLINECKKNGCLKLGQARSLIKIDVNKTRKLYDFLLTNGMINKE